MKKGMRLSIHGRVQGVFFRAETVERASALNLTGYVRNAYDGTVEVLAEGEERPLQELLAWCHKGPSAAKVAQVEVEWTAYSDGHKGFTIRY